MIRSRTPLPAAVILLAVAAVVRGQELPKPLVMGLKNPESVAAGADGRIYVSTIGEVGKDGDGAILVIAVGKATPVAPGLDDPKGAVGTPAGVFVPRKTPLPPRGRKGNP